MKNVRMDIDDLANICGFFTSKTKNNNGYGCTNPKRTDDKGCCHRTGCPLAWYDSEEDQMVIFDEKLLTQMLHKEPIGDNK